MIKMVELNSIRDFASKASILAGNAGFTGTAMTLYTGFMIVNFVFGGLK